MKRAIDIHDMNKRLASAKRLVAKSNPITERNSEYISKFEDYGFTTGLSKKRITKYVYSARILKSPTFSASKSNSKNLVFDSAGI